MTVATVSRPRSWRFPHQSLNRIREAFIQKHPEAAEFSYNVFSRFASGYNFDFNEAMNRLEFFLNWWKTNNIAAAKPSDTPNIDSLRPITIIGKTRNGYGLLLLRLRKLYLKNNPPDDVARYVSAMALEVLRSHTDPTVDRYIMIMDVKGSSGDNFDKAGLQKLTPIFSNCFPDVLFRMYIVNVGFVASTLYSVVSVMMHEVTRKKIQVIKEDNDKIKAATADEIDLAQLPKEMGGAFEAGP